MEGEPSSMPGKMWVWISTIQAFEKEGRDEASAPESSLYLLKEAAAGRK
jgi:hypothetical protein